MTSRQDIITKAAEDDAFREQLKRDPRATVEHEFGAPLPAGMDVTVLEESPNHAYLVLPMSSSELSEDELARLSAAGQATGLLVNYSCSPWC